MTPAPHGSRFEGNLRHSGLQMTKNSQSFSSISSPENRPLFSSHLPSSPPRLLHSSSTSPFLILILHSHPFFSRLLIHLLCPLALPYRISPAGLFNRGECLLLFVQLFNDCALQSARARVQTLVAADAVVNSCSSDALCSHTRTRHTHHPTIWQF